MKKKKINDIFDEMQARQASSTSQGTTLSILDFCKDLQLKTGKFSFEGRQYLKDILTDKSPTVMVRKGRQVGMTVTAVALILYNALKYPGTTHIYSTGDDRKIRYFSLDNFLEIITRSGINLREGKSDQIMTNYRLPNGSVSIPDYRS